MESIVVDTRQRSQMLDITIKVQSLLNELNIKNGVVLLYVPHTTAGITINENADPTVVADLIQELDRLVPWSQRHYTHREGNSAAHIKASLVGSTVSVPIEDERLALGRWQGIFFCEFDGPRTRRVQIVIQSR
jgi:secondary thiamine-phosphate synthase enzyme